MIKFFRRIRQRLLSENKFSKYLLYAIGEIVLVVIGILIALQINNWNEQKKTKEFEHQILKDISNSLQINFFQIDMCLESTRASIASIDTILKHLEENLPYHDSLESHFSKSVEWCSPTFSNAGYESLKTYGRNLVTNDSLRERLSIYDAGWMETLGQRQEDYFFNTASPILTELFETVAMRTEMRPFDYTVLKESKQYLSVLKTSKAYRKDQEYWYSFWRDLLLETEKLIGEELNK